MSKVFILVLIILIQPYVFAKTDQGLGSSSLANTMKSMGQKLKQIQIQSFDSTKNASSAVLCDELVKLIEDSRAYDPDPARKSLYNQMIDDSLRLSRQLGDAFRANDTTKVAEVMKELVTSKQKGHAEFK